MPAAAVIPAPIAYIKVVAVKKLVVGSRVSPARGLAGLVASAACVALPSAPNRRGGSSRPRAADPAPSPARGGQLRVPLAGWPAAPVRFTLKKLECSRQASDGLNNGAWNNGIGPRFYFVGSSELEVMIKRDRRGHSYCGVRGEILGPPQDELLRKHLPRMFSLIKNESQRFEDDQIPS